MSIFMSTNRPMSSAKKQLSVKVAIKRTLGGPRVELNTWPSYCIRVSPEFRETTYAKK